jgi:hypothetical protein
MKGVLLTERLEHDVDRITVSQEISRCAIKGTVSLEPQRTLGSTDTSYDHVIDSYILDLIIEEQSATVSASSQ